MTESYSHLNNYVAAYIQQSRGKQSGRARRCRNSF